VRTRLIARENDVPLTQIVCDLFDLPDTVIMPSPMHAAAVTSLPPATRQRRGAVLRSALLSPAERSAQARKAAQAKWARSREAEDAPAIRGRVIQLRRTRGNLLAALLENATNGAKGKPVKSKEGLAAVRAGLAELRMEIPLLELRLLQLADSAQCPPCSPPEPPEPPWNREIAWD
jgi:hypothetical protein